MQILKSLASFRTPGDGSTAPGEFVCREVTGAQPFATHWHNTQDGGYYFGHYFDTESEAMADFLERCQGWMKRYASFAYVREAQRNRQLEAEVLERGSFK